MSQLQSYIASFQARKEERTKCSLLNINKILHQNDPQYAEQVEAIQDVLYNILTLLNNINDKDIKDIKDISKPNKNTHVALLALLSISAGSSKQLSNEILFKKQVDWLETQNFFCQHYNLIKDYLLKLQTNMIKRKFKQNNLNYYQQYMSQLKYNKEKLHDYNNDSINNVPATTKILELTSYLQDYFQQFRVIQKQNEDKAKIERLTKKAQKSPNKYKIKEENPHRESFIVKFDFPPIDVNQDDLQQIDSDEVSSNSSQEEQFQQKEQVQEQQAEVKQKDASNSPKKSKLLKGSPTKSGKQSNKQKTKSSNQIREESIQNQLQKEKEQKNMKHNSMLQTYQERMSKIFDETSKLKIENVQLIEDLRENELSTKQATKFNNKAFAALTRQNKQSADGEETNKEFTEFQGTLSPKLDVDENQVIKEESEDETNKKQVSSNTKTPSKSQPKNNGQKISSTKQPISSNKDVKSGVQKSPAGKGVKGNSPTVRKNLQSR